MERIIAFAAAIVIAYFTFAQLTSSQNQAYTMDRAVNELGQAARGFCACNANNSDCLTRHLDKIKSQRKNFERMDNENIKLTPAQQARIGEIMAYVKSCHSRKRR